MFNRRMREARLNAGLTQEKLARAMDMTTMTIRQWEYGNTQPTLDRFLMLADVLGVSIDWLAGGSK